MSIHQNVWRAILVVAVFVGIALMITHPKAGADTQPGPQNGNTVQLSHNTYKWCDGPNLIYVNHNGYNSAGENIAVLANSPECK